MVRVPQQAQPLQVTVVAESRETNDGLHAYLQGAGVSSRTTRALADMVEVSPATTAVVLFPDEFDAKEVVNHISSLRAQRPRTLVVVVTSGPQHIRAALSPDGQSLLPIVLPKPAFGWSILDAIRAHAHAESS